MANESRLVGVKGQREALLVDGIFTTRFLRRVEYGLRQGLAVGIACVWVLIPTFAKPLSQVAFLGVVLALISCGENFGRTVRSAVLCLTAAVGGALLVAAWHAVAGTSYGASWGGVALFSFLLTYPRFDPLALKISQVLNVSGLITFHLNPTLPWYFPFQAACACAIGCGSALVALVLPYPRVASAEAKARVATAAKVSAATFSSLVESYIALSDERATFMQLQGSYLLQSAEMNLGWFQAVLPDLRYEPWVRRTWACQVTAYVKLAKELTACLQGMQRAATDWDVQHSAHNPLKSKMAAALRRVGACTGYTLGKEAAMLRGAHHDPAETGGNDGDGTMDEAVLQGFLHDLQLAREYAYYREPYLEKDRLVYPTLPLWGMLASSFFLFHAYQYAWTVQKAQTALARGASPQQSSPAEEQQNEQAQVPAAPKGLVSVAARRAGTVGKAVKAGILSWLAPDADKLKEAVRRTAALVSAGIVGLALSPYGLWAAIAAAFVGGARIGGSFSTAANRLQGSVAGAVAGFLLLLAVSRVTPLIGVALAIWVAISGYVRTNTSYGYAGLVGGFTAILIMLGQPPDIPRSTLETYAFTRLYEQCIGILFVVFFDYALWPARAVKLIQQKSIANLQREGALWSLLLRKYLDARTLEHRHAAAAELAALEEAIAASVTDQKQLAKEAVGEPQLWHAPFPAAPWGALLAGQSSVVRLMGTIRKTLSVRSSEVLVEQIDVLVQPLRPQLEVLGREIQATFSGLVASLGGSPDLPAPDPSAKARGQSSQRTWLDYLQRCARWAKLPCARQEQSSGEDMAQGQSRATGGSTQGNSSAPLPASRSGLSTMSSLEQGSNVSEGSSPRGGGVDGPSWQGAEPVRTWSMPRLNVDVNQYALGHQRQGAAPQGTRSEGNTPRLQPDRKASLACSQRVIDEIDARIAAVERDEEEKAARQRERHLSHEFGSRDGGSAASQLGVSRRSKSLSRRGWASPAPLRAVRAVEEVVEVVVVRPGEVELAQQGLGGVPKSNGHMSPSSSYSSGSMSRGQSAAWNEVTIQGGVVPPVVLQAQEGQGTEPVGGTARPTALSDGSACCTEGHTGGRATIEGAKVPGPKAAGGLLGARGTAATTNGLDQQQTSFHSTSGAEEGADQAEVASSSDTDGESEGDPPDLMVGPTLRERRLRALAGLQRRYEAVIQGLIAAKRAEPERPLLSSEALLHFNALVYSMRLLIQELEKMEQAIRELRQMSRPIRLGTIAQLPYDVAIKREAAYDQDPVTILLGPGPTPSVLWRHRITEEEDEGKEE